MNGGYLSKSCFYKAERGDMESHNESTSSINLALSPADIPARFNRYRQLVAEIAFKRDLLQTVCAQMDSFGGSVIERRGSEKEDVIFKISRVDEITSEIMALEEERRMEYPRLKALSDRLHSKEQRHVIELRDYQALPWGEVTRLMHGKDSKAFRHNCQATRWNAMATMRRQLKSLE